MTRSTRRPLALLALLLLFVMACQLPGGGAGPTPTPQTPRLTLEMLRNATYQSEDWHEPIPLVDGRFDIPPPEGEPQANWYYAFEEPFAIGDLDGDGVEDAAVILAHRLGGTGIFRELAAVINEGGAPNNVSTVALGDRPIINAISIADGIITLDMVVVGPGDPACCPNTPETRRYQLVGGVLTRLP